MKLTRRLLVCLSALMIIAGAATSGQAAASNSGGKEAHDNGQAYMRYITPEDKEIQRLAGNVTNPKEVYQLSGGWNYVEDKVLNGVIERWLTPRQFLTETRVYEKNPVSGQPAGDCEEFANALASMLRASGVPAEDVRVVMGKSLLSEGRGHVWVELLTDGEWLALDASFSTFWDSERGILTKRALLPFSYYRTHAFPTFDIEAYYNDKYYYKPGNKSDSIPDSWLAGKKSRDLR